MHQRREGARACPRTNCCYEESEGRVESIHGPSPTQRSCHGEARRRSWNPRLARAATKSVAAGHRIERWAFVRGVLPHRHAFSPRSEPERVAARLSHEPIRHDQQGCLTRYRRRHAGARPLSNARSFDLDCSVAPSVVARTVHTRSACCNPTRARPTNPFRRHPCGAPRVTNRFLRRRVVTTR